MMEIAFGPVVLACALQSLAFGVLMALVFPMISARIGGNADGSLARRAGLGLVGFGVFGVAHLAIVCAADGFPPRIVLSVGIAMLVAAMAGLLLAGMNQRRAMAA